MTDLTRHLELTNLLIAQSVTRGRGYRARLAAARDNKEVFISNTLLNREIKCYRKLIIARDQLSALPVDCRLGYRDGVGYVALAA